MHIITTPEGIWKNLQEVRQRSPLIHNITNAVVMEQTANALLSLGASPVMTEAVEEAAEMAQIASALVINMGTLTPRWLQSAKLAAETAHSRRIPIIFDPVGVGATAYRTSTAHALLDFTNFTVIRGNASEIAQLSGAAGMATKGVDSAHCGTSCRAEAKKLSETTRSVVVVSGEIDLITDGKRKYFIRNGDPLMSKVTGMGCTATVLIAAFTAVEKQPLQAALNSMAVMGIAGELAAQLAPFPGSFKTAFIDTLFAITLKDIQKHLKIEIPA